MTAIYNKIGDNYDTTRKADPEITATLAHLLNIQKDKHYLDVACGTGNYTIELNKLGGKWYGFDQSQKMLNEATAKSSEIRWSNFDIENLGYADNQFDGAICSLAIHHFKDLNTAFSEIARVLKSNSNLVIFTSTPEQMNHYWLAHYFPDMMQKSCAQMPSLSAIETALAENQFNTLSIKPFFITEHLQDFFLYSGKQRPEIYLLETVRNGISSFKNFCTHTELQQGLTKLDGDIQSGAIYNLINQFHHDGDYLFLMAKKS
ncbi:MAG: SAM-dependent methyltransferase [Gammaproteobacteria bacterium]|nr:MAG: SAM-dependent methyltransferase [Gammaproteobacteria bacterium]